MKLEPLNFCYTDPFVCLLLICVGEVPSCLNRLIDSPSAGAVMLASTYRRIVRDSAGRYLGVTNPITGHSSDTSINGSFRTLTVIKPGARHLWSHSFSRKDSEPETIDGLDSRLSPEEFGQALKAQDPAGRICFDRTIPDLTYFKARLVRIYSRSLSTHCYRCTDN